jgi:hypothetical protein
MLGISSFCTREKIPIATVAYHPKRGLLVAARARRRRQASQRPLDERDRGRAWPPAVVAGVAEGLDAVAPSPLFRRDPMNEKPGEPVHARTLPCGGFGWPVCSIA